jgi:replicative DNA helicase
VPEIEEYINRSELKIGKRPSVVMIDYIGLIQGGGNKRYERMSTIAEEVKVLAKSTNTVVFLASQKRRTEEQGVGLHDAKDSGSVENSSALVLGLSRPSKDMMQVKVLKQTRGTSGHTAHIPFDGERMQFAGPAWEPPLDVDEWIPEEF